MSMDVISNNGQRLHQRSSSAAAPCSQDLMYRAAAPARPGGRDATQHRPAPAIGHGRAWLGASTDDSLNNTGGEMDIAINGRVSCKWNCPTAQGYTVTARCNATRTRPVDHGVRLCD